MITQVVVTTSSWPGKGWQIVNCDVGQGDGLVINLGKKSAIVIDTGPDSKAIDQCLKSLKIREIPLLILTHFHADHVGAISAVLENRVIGEVWISNLYEPEAAYEVVMKQLSGKTVKSVFAGDRYFFDSNNTNIQVLWPITHSGGCLKSFSSWLCLSISTYAGDAESKGRDYQCG